MFFLLDLGNVLVNTFNQRLRAYSGYVRKIINRFPKLLIKKYQF